MEDRVREIIHATPDLTGIVLDCAGINFIDSQRSAKLNDVVKLAAESEVILRLARLKAAVSATLERDGVLQRIGADNIHGNVATAIQAQLATPTPPSRSAQPEGD